MRLIYLIITGAFLEICSAGDDGNESDGDTSRKILGSSVVTSVSVIMDTSNKKNIFTDAVGKPQTKPSNPSELASPIDLLNPDRYEFYTFDENGDLVKRRMSLEEIKSIIATEDSGEWVDSFMVPGFLPEKRVNAVVTNVKSVVKQEMKNHKNVTATMATPNVTDCWSMILPAVFGNSGEDKPEIPVGCVIPDTVILEPSAPISTSEAEKVNILATSASTISSTTRQPVSSTSAIPTTTHIIPSYYSSPTSHLTTETTSSTEPNLKVEIISNGASTTEVVPTRPPTKPSTSPPIIRNLTKSTTQKIKPITFISTTPLTTKIASSTTSKPATTTTQWSSTSLKATTKLKNKESEKPSTGFTVPNIFNLPEHINSGSNSSANKPSKIVSNIFGLPSAELKNNPLNLFTAAPTKPGTTLIASSTSQIKIKPQITTAASVNKTTTQSTTVPNAWTPSPEDLKLFSMFSNVIRQSSTTENNRVVTSPQEQSTEYLTTDTIINDLINFESNKLTTENLDLSTLPSEQIINQNVSSTTIISEAEIENVATTKLPPLLNSLNYNQQLSASELIGQLLPTTNIYEINTELASSKLNSTNTDNRFDNGDVQMTQDSENQMTTIEQDVISYPPTPTLIESIEQLLSQAVDDVGGILKQTTESQYETDLSKEAEFDIAQQSTASNLETTTLAYNLNGSLEAILTDLTEKPNWAVTNRRADVDITTTKTSSTEREPDNKEQIVTSTELDQDTTTFYYVIRTEPKNSTEASVQMINITVLNQNRTKPAKSDLSLEHELIEQEVKNISNSTEANEVLKASESNSEHFDLTTMMNDAPTTIQEVNPESTTYDGTTESLDQTSTLAFTTAADATRFDETTTDSQPIVDNVTELIQSSTVKTIPKPSIVITINENNTLITENGKLVANKTYSTESPTIKEEKNSTQDQTWTLVSTLAPQQASNQNLPPPTIPYPEILDNPVPVDLVAKPMQGFGLEESTSSLNIDIHQFAQLCNELAFGFWKTVTTGLSPARSIFVSPFAATSMLAMVFLGAKGATSEEMNEILKLDDMVTFNPHLTFKSVSESIVSEPNSGIATTAIIRELFSDRSKGKLLDFYKNRVRAFYDGFVEEVSYREIGDVIRRRSNLLVKKYTNGKYTQFFGDASIVPRSPLSGISINIFETDCSQTSTEGRDGELHFIVFPSIKQRRLVPIPAVVYKFGFLAGYEPSLDATAVALGSKDQIVSTILVIPGQQGIAAPGDGLARLEKRLVESSFKKGAWSRLLRSLIPRPGLEVQIPRFSHRSVINTTNTLQRMGLHELFNPTSADLRGLNGVANELHLSDVLQVNKFATCGDIKGDETHHSEVYPATTMRGRAARRLDYILSRDQDEPRDYQRAFHDPLHDPSLFALPLSLRPRQARIPEIPRLRFDRPFLYFVRHNPTGLIIHMGRFNPRLLP